MNIIGEMKELKMDTNKILRNDFIYFLEKQGYSVTTPSGNPSTVYDYAKRIDGVCKTENLTWEGMASVIDNIVQEYSPNGIKGYLGTKSHNSVINALKQYNKFIKEKHPNIAKEPNTPFVVDKEDLLQNLKTLDDYLQNKNSDALDLIKNGICFIALEKNDGYHFYPSRFVGYKNNTIEQHKHNNVKDGRKTNPVIDNILGVHEINDSLESKFLEYCKRLNIIPRNNNRKYWLISDIQMSKAIKVDNINQIEKSDINELEKQALIKVRLGHSKLRDNVLKQRGKCEICGISHHKLLIVSHIKPWAEAENDEKLDPDNVLLLCAMHDALFDKGLISFDDNGKILISNEISPKDYALFNIDSNIHLRISSTRQKEYLKYHRENILL